MPPATASAATASSRAAARSRAPARRRARGTSGSPPSRCSRIASASGLAANVSTSVQVRVLGLGGEVLDQRARCPPRTARRPVLAAAPRTPPPATRSAWCMPTFCAPRNARPWTRRSRRRSGWTRSRAARSRGSSAPARPFSATIAAVASTIRSRWLFTITSRGSSLRPLGSGRAARARRRPAGRGRRARARAWLLAARLRARPAAAAGSSPPSRSALARAPAARLTALAQAARRHLADAADERRDASGRRPRTGPAASGWRGCTLRARRARGAVSGAPSARRRTRRARAARWPAARRRPARANARSAPSRRCSGAGPPRGGRRRSPAAARPAMSS